MTLSLQAHPLNSEIHEDQRDGLCHAALRQFVSHAPEMLSARDYIAIEGELDAVIRELGECSVNASKAGDMELARDYAARMYRAIRSRTPQHQARLQAEREARIVDELSFQGEWTEEVMRGRIG